MSAMEQVGPERTSLRWLTLEFQNSAILGAGNKGVFIGGNSLSCVHLQFCAFF